MARRGHLHPPRQSSTTSIHRRGLPTCLPAGSLRQAHSRTAALELAASKRRARRLSAISPPPKRPSRGAWPDAYTFHRPTAPVRVPADRHRGRRCLEPWRELRVVRQLEGLHPVRLEAVRRPDALHAAVANPSCPGHRRRAQCVISPGGSASVIASARSWACLCGLHLPVCRWIAILPTPSPLNGTIRARHTCFCGLFPDPITASSRSRSPGPSRTSTPFLIPADSHICEPSGTIRQRQSTLMSPVKHTAHGFPSPRGLIVKFLCRWIVQRRRRDPKTSVNRL